MSTKSLDQKERIEIGNKIIRITIILNLILTLFKVGAGYVGNSSAILADGLHSASDIVTSVGVIIGMILASKPKDEKHQYGHEKAESLAGFLLAGILTITGINIGYQSIIMIFRHTYEMPHIYTAIVALVSIFVKEYQFRITRDAAEKLNSNAMMGDAWHHRSDAFSSIAALVGIIGARLGYLFLDPLAGTIVAVIVVKIGIELLLVAIDELMDGAIDKEQMNEIIKEIRKVEGIKCIREIRGRKHGSKAYIDIKISVDPFISVYKGHNIGERVEELVCSKIQNVKDVVVHIDPCGKELDEEKCNEDCL